MLQPVPLLVVSPLLALLLGMPTEAVTVLMLVTSTFEALLTYIGFTLSLCAGLTVLGVMVLRRREPGLERPYRAWGYPLTPLLFVLLALTNALQLIPLALGNAIPFEIEMGGRTASDARRFVSVTAHPRFLFLGHLSELIFPYEGPSETM